MITLKQTVIVEGKYDKIRLQSLLNAFILPTNGFQIFQDKEKRILIRRLAHETGIVVLTDSDKAGQLIRNHIKSIAKGGKIWNAYIPEILGKEQRKTLPSKAGTLGVEGMPTHVLKEALHRAGVMEGTPRKLAHLTKANLMLDGLSGGKNSYEKRQKLLKILKLPSSLSANALLELLNATTTEEEYRSLLEKLEEKEEPHNAIY